MTTIQKIAPFYMSTEDWGDQELQDVLDTLVDMGYSPDEKVKGTRSKHFSWAVSMRPNHWKLVGISKGSTQFFTDEMSYDNDNFLTKQELLDLLSPSASQHPLRNVYIKVLDGDHSIAIQEAVFKSGGGWITSGKNLVDIDQGAYLNISEEGAITYTPSKRFLPVGGKEVTFTYTRNLDYQVQEVVPETIDINGKIYKKAEYDDAISTLTPVGL